MVNVQILGITDDITTCEACGKSNLKRTVVLDFGGQVRYFGCDCAGAALNGKKSTKNTATITRRAEALQLAKNMLVAGKSPTEAATAAWNRFGFPVLAQGDAVKFSFGAVTA